MATEFVPKNKIIEPIMVNIAGAQLLRDVIGGDAEISGTGCAPYTDKKTATSYSKRINQFLIQNPGNEHYNWLNKYAYFFKNCDGFWQR